MKFLLLFSIIYPTSIFSLLSIVGGIGDIKDKMM